MKTIAKESDQLKKECVFKLGDGRKSYSRETLGVVDNLYVMPSLTSIALLELKGPRLLIYG